MKQEQSNIIALASLSFISGVVLTIAISNSVNTRSSLNRLENIEINQGHEFIWNDDIESVPATGYVKVDTIINNTVYLSPDED